MSYWVEARVAANGLKTVSANLEQAFLAYRRQLLAFFRARNVGDASEDLLQELWMRLPADDSHISAPLPYMFRIAETLVINRYRREQQGRKRERDWSEANDLATEVHSQQPRADRVMEAREEAARVLAALQGQGDRVFRIFQRHRIDGLTQSAVAAEIGVSISTVESDLRRAYHVLSVLRRSE